MSLKIRSMVFPHFIFNKAIAVNVIVLVTLVEKFHYFIVGKIGNSGSDMRNTLNPII